MEVGCKYDTELVVVQRLAEGLGIVCKDGFEVGSKVGFVQDFKVGAEGNNSEV